MIFLEKQNQERNWKDWCWSWNSNTLATWCEELTHLKRPWFWERLKVGGEGDDRGWDGWMASLTQWTWVWVNSGNWWWTGRPGVLQSMGLQSWTQLSYWTELNWQSALIIHFTHRLISVSQSIPYYMPPSPPWYPYVCSLHMCLYFCFANKIIHIIFIESTYMC